MGKNSVSLLLTVLLATLFAHKVEVSAFVADQSLTTDTAGDDVSSHFDAPMKMVRRDGRHADQVSVFEEMRLKLEELENTHGPLTADHPLLSATGEGVDVAMEMLYDWNHIVNIKLNRTAEPIQVIPSTGLQDLTLMHPNCNACYSMHGEKWVPDVHTPLGTNMTSNVIDFFY